MKQSTKGGLTYDGSTGEMMPDTCKEFCFASFFNKSSNEGKPVNTVLQGNVSEYGVELLTLYPSTGCNITIPNLLSPRHLCSPVHVLACDGVSNEPGQVERPGPDDWPANSRHLKKHQDKFFTLEQQYWAYRWWHPWRLVWWPPWWGPCLRWPDHQTPCCDWWRPCLDDLFTRYLAVTDEDLA